MDSTGVNIVKHGKVRNSITVIDTEIRFICGHCGCEFVANQSYHGGLKSGLLGEYYEAVCPECRAEVVTCVTQPQWFNQSLEEVFKDDPFMQRLTR